MNKKQLKGLLDKHKQWVHLTEDYVQIKDIMKLNPEDTQFIEDSFISVVNEHFPNSASKIYEWFETDLAGNPNKSYDELWESIKNK